MLLGVGVTLAVPLLVLLGVGVKLGVTLHVSEGVAVGVPVEEIMSGTVPLLPPTPLVVGVSNRTLLALGHELTLRECNGVEEVEELFEGRGEEDTLREGRALREIEVEGRHGRH